MRSGWVAAMVRTGKEEAVAVKLRSDLSLDSYCPIFSKWRKLPKHKVAAGGKTRVLVRTPMIPGYVFVKHDPDGSIKQAKDIDGFIGLLSVNDNPCFARDEEISMLKDIEKSGKFNELKSSKPTINLERLLGTEVQISLGPLSGFKGKAIKINKNEIVLDMGSFIATVDESSI